MRDSEVVMRSPYAPGSDMRALQASAEPAAVAAQLRSGRAKACRGRSG